MRRNMEVWTQFAVAALTGVIAGHIRDDLDYRDAAMQASAYADHMYKQWEQRMRASLEAAAPGPEVTE